MKMKKQLKELYNRTTYYKKNKLIYSLNIQVASIKKSIA